MLELSSLPARTFAYLAPFRGPYSQFCHAAFRATSFSSSSGNRGKRFGAFNHPSTSGRGLPLSAAATSVSSPPYFGLISEVGSSRLIVYCGGASNAPRVASSNSWSSLVGGNAPTRINDQQPAPASPTAARLSAAIVATACGASNAAISLLKAVSPYASVCAFERLPLRSADTRSSK